MNEVPGAPSEPAAPPRLRWRDILLFILLCVLAVAMISYGLAYMAGGKPGVWGASHTPGAHR